MKRQEIYNRAKPPHIWAIIDESVIWSAVGSREVMREQLEHLLRAQRVAQIADLG